MSNPISGYLPGSRFTSTLPMPVQGGGAFVLDGATDPSERAGDVISVRRLEDAGADPFFRVRVSCLLPISALSTLIIGGVRGTAIADEPAYNILAVTADPVAAKDAVFEFDVVVLNAGVAVDTAGFWFQFVFAAATGQSGIVEAA